jgi:hypothetical protein
MLSLLRDNERVATHAQLMELGLQWSTISYRIRPNGPWQRLYPGVVLAHSGRPTRREKLLGARAYAGEDSMVTGLPGLRLHDVKAAERRQLEVPHMLVPHEVRRSGHHLLVVERCRRLPDPVIRQGLPLAPLPKCLVDAARRESELDMVREAVAECVQRGKCTATELRDEVKRAARQRTALSRHALAEIEAGVRSVAEARIRRAVMASDLPVPLFNPTLWTPDGEFIGSPDGYFPHCAAGWQVDSFAYHLGRGQQLRTQRRQRSYAGYGVWLVPVSPVDGYDNPAAFVAELRALVRAAEARTLPDIIVRPADAS